MILPRKLAVCVHVYYEDMWDYMAGYLRNIPEGADFFITCREEIHVELSKRVLDEFPNAEIVIMPNLGMDVLPFLTLCRDKDLHKYDAVLKLHTKNQKSKLRAEQGKIVLDGLCGSEALVRKIADTFSNDPEAGMVGTAFQLRSANALMYGNRARMADLLERLGIALTDWPFFTGTMFWIAGFLLRDIVDIVPELVQQAKTEEKSRTGGDGTLAHALERVFGALNDADAATIYVTERKDPDSGEYLLLPRWQHGPANRHRLLELDSTELLRRYVEASQWCKVIQESDLFDSSTYRETSRFDAVQGMDDAYHFVLYGDLLTLDPGPHFNVSYYQIRRQDVRRAKICSLVHYLQAGRRDGTTATPNMQDWFELAKLVGLFDETWYAETYPDVPLSGLGPEKHYHLIGQHIGRSTNTNFQPDQIPVIARDDTFGGKSIEAFLKRHFLHEQKLYETLKRAGDNGDFVLVKSLSRRILYRYGPGRALNEAIATNHILNFRWSEALASWETFWAEIEAGQNSCRHVPSVMQFDHPSRPLPDFKTIDLTAMTGHLSGSSAAKEDKVCIYTTLFGDIDDLVPVLNPAEGVDYLCFTDRLRTASGWTQIIVHPQQTSDNLNAKIFKVLPHKYLQQYEYSMFVDANTVFLGRTNEFIEICRLGGDFVMWQHPLRSDAYTEVCAIIGHRRHSPGKLIDQIRHYAEDGMPRNTGMFEASFIWRRHSAPEVTDLMEQWWDHIQRFSSRDQISLAYLVWKTGRRPHLLPRSLGTSRDNIFFFKAKHRHGAARNDTRENALLSAPAVGAAPRDITFLFHEKFAGAGSTVLRGQQLSDLVMERYGTERRVRYISDPADIRDEVIVLTKGFLKMTTQDQLHDLRKNNILIADFVDEPPKKALIGELDVLMASSLCGYKEYISTFSEVAAFHVTHHVDVRIPRCEEATTAEFRAGYFGELVNTVQHESINDLVDFNLVDTSKQTNDWIDALTGYNFHYAFRRRRGIDGAKPFLKGFVAAHRGVNMMIQKTAGDASFYLGSDYPYLMEDDASIEEIAERLKHVRDTIGGPEWRYGREIMRDVQARSSIDYVLGEFVAMMKAL